jgi:hypothetical protein
MTDTVKPKWQLILGLLPSLNTAIVAIVTAAVSVGATLATQYYVAPKPVFPAADVPKPVPVVAAPVARLADLGDINTKLNTLLERVPVKADPAPVVAPPAEKPKPKKAKKKRDNGWIFSNWKLSI